MKKSTTVHVRIPHALKKSAQEVAEANGLDLSSCIRIFLTHMQVRGVLPLSPLTVNGFTEAEEAEILRRQREPMIPIRSIGAFLRSHRA